MSDGRLLELLIDLLNTSRISAGLLEDSVRQHPELLTQDAQDWLKRLAQAQESPETRTRVDDLARILRRLQTETMAVVFSDEARRSKLRAARHTRQERHRAARERFLAWRNELRSTSHEPEQVPPLPSLSEVIAQLGSIAISERHQPYGRDVLAAQTAAYAIPAFVYRGESGTFPNTYSSLARLRASTGSLQDVARIREHLVRGFHDKFGLTPPQALGFLQHYGFPTEYIDVTSDLSVAASFASSLRAGDVGTMCIVPTAPLLARGSLIDLRQHPLGRRPRLQSAFAVHVPEYPDLKARDAVEALQLRWIQFRFTEFDARRTPDFALLDARSDEVAGLIWLLIGDCGKFSDEAAAILSHRIDPAPVFAVADSKGALALVCEDDVAPEEPISDDDFRRSHYVQWSDAFEHPELPPLPPQFESAIRGTEVKPGDVLRLLSSKVFAKAEKRES